MLEVEGFAKQSSAGLICRCIHCHGIFKLFSYCAKKDVIYSEFECDCGRVIKIEETKVSSSKQIDESTIMPCFSKEVEPR